MWYADASGGQSYLLGLFLNHYLSLHGFADSARLACQRTPSLLLSHLPSLSSSGITGASQHIWSCSVGIKLNPSCLQGKHFNDLSPGLLSFGRVTIKGKIDLPNVARGKSVGSSKACLEPECSEQVMEDTKLQTSPTTNTANCYNGTTY